MFSWRRLFCPFSFSPSQRHFESLNFARWKNPRPPHKIRSKRRTKRLTGILVPHIHVCFSKCSKIGFEIISKNDFWDPKSTNSDFDSSFRDFFSVCGTKSARFSLSLWLFLLRLRSFSFSLSLLFLELSRHFHFHFRFYFYFCFHFWFCFHFCFHFYFHFCFDFYFGFWFWLLFWLLFSLLIWTFDLAADSILGFILTFVFGFDFWFCFEFYFGFCFGQQKKNATHKTLSFRFSISITCLMCGKSIISCSVRYLSSSSIASPTSLSFSFGFQ